MGTHSQSELDPHGKFSNRELQSQDTFHNKTSILCRTQKRFTIIIGVKVYALNNVHHIMMEIILRVLSTRRIICVGVCVGGSLCVLADERYNLAGFLFNRDRTSNHQNTPSISNLGVIRNFSENAMRKIMVALAILTNDLLQNTIPIRLQQLLVIIHGSVVSNKKYFYKIQMSIRERHT